jgi:hypothetical protein
MLIKIFPFHKPTFQVGLLLKKYLFRVVKSNTIFAKKINFL